MAKLKPEDLDRISEKIKRTTLLREGSSRARVIVHMGTCGIAAGARGVMKALLDEIEAGDIKDVMVTTSSCAGLCSREPMMTVELQGRPAVKYIDVTPEKVKEIFSKHVLGEEIVTEYALAAGSERML
jgi:NADP-reducing hydrogenase subunit HndB